MTIQTLINGFPRIGENRELKKVLENYWAHKIPFDEVQDTAQVLRKKHWRVQKDAGIDFISSNDFASRYSDSIFPGSRWKIRSSLNSGTIKW